MQKYKEINGNDYVKNSRTTINETMQSIQSMNSGTAFPTNNLFEGMKCYRTDLKKTYTLTDVENNTWVEDDTASKLATARKINITGDATGAASFDGSGDVSINTTVNSATKATSWGAGTSSLINDIATVNNSDTWIPVVSNGKLQHTEKLNMKVGAAVTADKVNDAGRKTAIKDGTHEPDGLHLYQCYDNGYPTTYGNVISIGGAGGGELLAGWSGADKGIEHLYYRNRRDAGALWSDWRTVAFTSDINSYAPTKTGTGASGTWDISITGNADKLDGYHASDLINKIYPVGSIYMSMSATNPATLFGVGTWARISQGRMLLGADDSTYKAGATGGEAAHTLSVNEMPEHSHTGTTSTNGEHSHSASWLYAWGGSDTWNYFAKSYSDSPGRASGGSFTIDNAGNHDHTFTTNNTGGGVAHNNMPPYLVCYIWQRTA